MAQYKYVKIGRYTSKVFSKNGAISFLEWKISVFMSHNSVAFFFYGSIAPPHPYTHTPPPPPLPVCDLHVVLNSNHY